MEVTTVAGQGDRATSQAEGACASKNEGEESSKDVGEESDEDQSYFMSYEDITVHALMLKDRPRTLAYKQYIEQNPGVFKDKVVVDVGAGTGILSLFCAKAGAKKVYAIEASGLAELCEMIVARNGYSDVITVIHDRAETATLPPGVKADVMVSEWMGFYLLHESMLDSLIVARERLLSPTGEMVPSQATLYFCPVTMKEYVRDNFDCWTSMYGFDFTPVLPVVKQKALTQPQIVTIEEKQCLAEPVMVSHLDLQFVQPEDVKTIRGQYEFSLTRHGLLHGFACWFDVTFGDDDVTLRTGPGAESTHWEQTVMLLPEAYLVNKGDSVCCLLELSQDKEHARRYNISVEMLENESEDEEDGEDAVSEANDAASQASVEKEQNERTIRDQLLNALQK